MIHPRYLLENFRKVLSNMDIEKKWLLMTYYCPTHGNLGIAKQIELTKKEVSETCLKKSRTLKNY